MTDFTNGSTSQSNSGEGKTDFTGNVNNQPNGNTNEQDNAVVFEFEGRKFTHADLVKKLKSADDFIETLKQERQQDRALLEQVNQKLSEQVNAQELLKQIKESGNTGATEGQVQKEIDKQAAANPEVSADAIAAKVLAQLESKRELDKHAQNWEDVTSKLTAVFGDKTNAKVAEVAKENNLTLQEAADIARKNPTLFLKLFPEMSTKPIKGALFEGSRNTQSFVKQPNKPSGFSSAKNTREQVNVYLNRLNELSGR